MNFKNKLRLQIYIQIDVTALLRVNFQKISLTSYLLKMFYILYNSDKATVVLSKLHTGK